MPSNFTSSKHPRDAHGRWITTGGKNHLPSDKVRAKLHRHMTPAQKAALKAVTGKSDDEAFTVERQQRAKTLLRGQLGDSQGSRRGKGKISVKNLTKPQLLAMLRSYDAADKQKALEAILTPKQKAALDKVKATKAKTKVKPEAKSEVEPTDKPVSTKTSTKVQQSVRAKLDKLAGVESLPEVPKYKLSKKTKEPSTPHEEPLRYPVVDNQVSFKGDHIDIWHGQPEYGKHKGDWKVHTQKDYDFKTEVDGKEVSLNKNIHRVNFEGETIHGVPDERPHIRQLNTDQLFRRLSTNMMYVENHSKRSIDPPAVKWSASKHGEIPKELRKNAAGKTIEYGSTDIHHIQQWAGINFKRISDRVRSGDMSLDDAKKEMLKYLEKVDTVDKNGKVKSVWQIKIPDDPKDRALILLPGGGHNLVNQKMYYALHPKGIHPETGDLEEFGIPKFGRWGRQTWFDGWSKRFWAESYKRDTYLVRNEINRRLKSGGLTKDQAEQAWKVAQDTNRKWHSDVKEKRQLLPRVKKTIYEDFLGDQKGLTRDKK